MKHKLLSMVMSICIVINLFFVVPVTVTGADINDTFIGDSYIGACGDNIRYLFDSETGTLTISGKGAMYDYNTYDDFVPWNDYKKLINSVVVENDVTSIGRVAFCNCSSLTSVSIPDSVSSIESGAFERCANLNEVKIPDSITLIGGYAFEECTSLNKVNIPDGITYIGDSAFNGCTKLEKVTLPDSATYIGLNAFNNTAFYNDETNWDNNAIYINNQLFTVKKEISGEFEIRNGTISVYSYAFCDCSKLTSVIIPDSVTSLGVSAFRNCSNMNEIKMSQNVSVIGKYAFAWCTKLTSITIPDKVSVIENDTFRSCLSLTNISIPDNVISIGEEVFFDCSSIMDIKISENVKKIGNKAFSGCSSLISIILPNKITTIDDEIFKDCINLKNITISDNLVSIGSTVFSDTAFYKDESNWVDGVLYINNYLIKVKENKSGEFKIKEGVKVIADRAFSLCKGITGVIFPHTVTCIGNWTFYLCYNLNNIEIPDSVKYIGDFAFQSCFKLSNIKVPENVKYIGKNSFSSTDLRNEDGFIIVNNILFSYVGKNENVIIPDGVTCIDDRAFHGCTYLTEIIIPESVTTIGDHAFEYCKNLKSIVIPDSVMNIGDYVFSECSELTNITLSNSVSSIGRDIFAYCPKLSEIYYSGNKRQWNSILLSKYNDIFYKASIHYTDLNDKGVCGDGVSYNFNELTGTLSISGKGSITNSPWYVYESLIQSVIIEKGITSVDNYAFWYCTNLVSITIPDSVESIGYCAFKECINLNYVFYGNTESQWEKINIGKYNDYLIDSTFTYTYPLSKPVVRQTILSLARSSANLYLKGITSIKATVKNGKGVTTYKTSNSRVAKVDSRGKVTALKAGTAKITVTNNKVSKVFTVKVVNPKLNKTSLNLKKGKTFTLKITGKVGTAKFSTSNKKIATVNSKGKIVAKKKGSATITVKTNGITLKCKVKVK